MSLKYKLLTLQIFFIKLFQIFFYTKLGILITTIVTLNKIKLNLLILSVMYFAIVANLQITKYTQLLIITSYLTNIRYCNFLQTFLFGLFKIHPPLFYISLIMYIPSIYTIQNGIKCRNTDLLFLSIVSLTLGSIWALYQLNWGSYWSSDPIEFALLFIIGIYIQNAHTFKLKTYLKFWTFYTILMYIQLIRSSLIYTKHNFFNNSSNFYIYLKIITLSLLLYLLTRNFYWHSTYTSQIKPFFTLNIIALILFANLSYNNYINKSLNHMAYITTMYIVIQIEWNLVKYWFTHVTIAIIVLIFISFKMQYTYTFYIKNCLKIWTHFKFNNSQIIIWFKHKLHIKIANISKHTKNENMLNAINYNFFFIKKKLSNYFI